MEFTNEFRAKFWSLVSPEDGGCWPWCGSLTDRGYGRCTHEGKRVRAHRVAWELTNGEIPDGLKALHHCDNRRCCNPGHLYIGTQRDNVIDMISRGRASFTKLSLAKAQEIRGRTGESYQVLAKQYGVTDESIYQVMSGRSWNFQPNELRGTNPRGVVNGK